MCLFDTLPVAKHAYCIFLHSEIWQLSSLALKEHQKDFRIVHNELLNSFYVRIPLGKAFGLKKQEEEEEALCKWILCENVS